MGGGLVGMEMEWDLETKTGETLPHYLSKLLAVRDAFRPFLGSPYHQHIHWLRSFICTVLLFYGHSSRSLLVFPCVFAPRLDPASKE